MVQAGDDILRQMEIDLKGVYELMPSGAFECRAGCSKCCGSPIIVFAQEKANIYACGTPANVVHDGRCAYLSNDGCGVYSVRPLICKIFGVLDKVNPLLKCCEGRRSKLTSKTQRRIHSEVKRVINKYRNSMVLL